MQHRSVDDPASHRPPKLGMGNTIKVAAEIRINGTRFNENVRPASGVSNFDCATPVRASVTEDCGP
jgi:hypothetical protein